MRTIWVVRAGAANALADAFEQESVIGLTVPFRDDASRATTAEIRAALDGAHPSQATNMAAILRRLVDEVAVGDLVITPGGSGRAVRVGEVQGAYHYDAQPAIPGLHHQRTMRWIASIGWEEISVGIRRALGSPMALYRPGAQEQLIHFLAERGVGAHS